MTVKIGRQTSEGRLIRTVEIMSDVDVSRCYQCKKCSSGCPVAKLTRSSPSEIVRRLHLGAGDELLESDLIWMCVSCETCYARCPMEINVASVIDALRTLARERGASEPDGDMPLFNSIFLRMVKSFGRSYDLLMIAVYKLGTRNLMQDTGKFPTMLMKGKMAILPPSGADKKMVKQIFSRAKQNVVAGK
jgi:heterodisulfide reductase subunit C2